MRQTILLLAIGACLLFGFSAPSHAFLGDIIDKFSKRPISKWVINGQTFVPTITRLSSGNFIKWVGPGGQTYETSEQYAEGRISQDTFYEGETEKKYIRTSKTYTPNQGGGIKTVEILTRFLPPRYMTPYLKECAPGGGQESCFKIKTIKRIVLPIYGGGNKILAGRLQEIYTTTDEREFVQSQTLLIERSGTDDLNISFTRSGRPWTHPDLWHRYSIDRDGGVVWTICRRTVPGKCHENNN